MDVGAIVGALFVGATVGLSVGLVVVGDKVGDSVGAGPKARYANPSQFCDNVCPIATYEFDCMLTEIAFT